ncbi:hypothetical protein E2C01_021522 [Portunus trituberculatus]|uniref:Uncharacterized protein n=1 Tax=Portunus trituberculatus TaxID=210409 RepID=A0A5B7E2U2_PORTR|nr:hypothetical protein [Portunus trituberculatus]
MSAYSLELFTPPVKPWPTARPTSASPCQQCSKYQTLQNPMKPDSRQIRLTGEEAHCNILVEMAREKRCM